MKIARENEKVIREWIVPRTASRERLDVFVARVADDLSRSRLQALIRDGHVTLNGKSARPRESLRENDCVMLEEPPLERLDLAPEASPLAVLFEDEDLVVLNKAAGVVVHPGAGRTSGTLVNALLAHCKNLSGIGGKERPGIVHRLDKETSGCIVVAKNDLSHVALSAQFAARDVQKIYLAIVAGQLRTNSGMIDAPITRHPIDRKRMAVAKSRGRSARTDYRVVQANKVASLLECEIHSGRTHQIRVHMQHIGHPVMGDRVYGGKMTEDFARQMLHAWKLGFAHPRSGKQLSFTAPIPDDFAEATRRLFP